MGEINSSIGTKEKSFGIVVNSEKENLSDVPQANDYECAIEEGASYIRIGTAIFGARDYSAKQ